MSNVKYHFLLLSFLILSILSCDELDKYPEGVYEVLNSKKAPKDEIIDAIHFFQKNDSSKLDALYALIISLNAEAWHMPDTAFDIIPRRLTTVTDLQLRKNLFTHLVDSIVRVTPNALIRNKEFRYESIDSKYLIESINLSYQAVDSLPKNLRPDNSSFIKYVIPDFDKDEPRELDLKKNLHHQYSWVYKIIRENNSIQVGVCHLIDSLNMGTFGKIRFPGVIPTSYVNNMKFSVCSDLVTLMVHILRSLGIPASNDYLPHWGNHPFYGHDWLVFVKDGNTCAIDAVNGNMLDSLYKYASIPKIFRKIINIPER